MCSSHLSLSAMALNTNTCGGTADWPSRSPSMVAWSYNERDFREAQAWDPYTAFNGFLCQGSKSGAGGRHSSRPGTARCTCRTLGEGALRTPTDGHTTPQTRAHGGPSGLFGLCIRAKKSCVFRDAGAPLSLSLSLRLGVY